MATRSDGTNSLPDALTQRERNILAHLANNLSSKEIAGLETLALSSVKWYIQQVYSKLGVNDRAAALARARELGLVGGRSDVPVQALTKSNLPRPLSSFIGREKEIAQLLELVRASPLVTLTGSGGTGKTRLALQVAQRALPDFPGGVWFVDLTSLSDPALLALVAASALGIHGISWETALPILIETIAHQRLLLVLDNCEHLITAAAGLAHALLSSCPGLHILATSREILGVGGEQALRCPPLSLPDPAESLDTAELTRFEALRLFAERGAEAAPGFQLTSANAGLVQQICLRLDGIPLAIELAAARLRLLSLQQIAEHMENLFHLLTGGGRSSMPRQKTLKAMIDWSYDLLSEPEQRLLARLSVFAGGWTMEAAEAVCSGPGLALEAVLDRLTQLADKSLVDVQFGRDDQPRYRLLEMVRQYAQDRLQEIHGLDAARERHLDFFRALAVQAEAGLLTKTTRWWIERLDDELPNLRAAMEWALAGPVVKGLRLAGGLHWFWSATRHRLEGMDWLERLLAAEEAGRSDRAEQGEALLERQFARGNALSALAYMGGLDNRGSHSLASEALAIFQPLAQIYPRETAYAWFVKLCFPGGQDGYDFSECLEMARRVDYPWLVAEIQVQNIFRACWAGDLEGARAYAGIAMDGYEQSGHMTGYAVPLWVQGTLALMLGRPAEAAGFFQATLDICQESGFVDMFSFVGQFPAWLALARGDYAEAAARSQAQLDQSLNLHLPWVMAVALGWLAWEALSSGDEDRAARFCQQAFELSDKAGADLFSVAHYAAARLALARGNLQEARLQLAKFVTHNYYNFPPVQLGLQLFAMLALEQGEIRRAALLLGAQDAISPCLLNVIPPPERAAYHSALAKTRALLSPPEFDTAFAQGQSLDTPQAIAYALGGE